MMCAAKNGWKLTLAAVVVLLGRLAVAQTDELAKTLNLTPATKSLPMWSKPAPDAVVDLTQLVRKYSPAIFMAGKPDQGFGTAFLVSKEHRLLATNAHVADIMREGKGDMLAIQNGTTNTFKVVKAYYHPGLRRRADGISMRSTESSMASVDSRSADVAILQLAEGSELPEELPLATRDELYDMFAQPVAMLGYPAHDTSNWPAAGQKAQASFREGVITRVADFRNDVNSAPSQQQYIQHSMAGWFGFSGSPVFLPNGHVVALHNSGGSLNQNGTSATLNYGIRSDCLWELLKANHLLDEVKVPAEAKEVDLERFSQPDPVDELVRQVKQLLLEARTEMSFKHYLEAIEKCNDAVKLLPYYAPSFAARGLVYSNYVANTFGLKDPKGLHYIQLSIDDVNRALQLNPQNSNYYLDQAVAMCSLVNRKAGDGKHHPLPSAAEVTDRLLADASASNLTKGYAHRARALALGYAPAALADLKQANDLAPYDYHVKFTTSGYYLENGNAKEAERYKSLGSKLQEAEGKRMQAFDLATNAEAGKRDGHKALQLATEACTATDYKLDLAVAALAAAYAETGDFDKAIETQKKVLKLSTDDHRDEYNRRLKSYQDHKPWRRE